MNRNFKRTPIGGDPHSFILFGEPEQPSPKKNSLLLRQKANQTQEHFSTDPNVIGQVVRIRTSDIIPDPNQPRKDFDQEKLQELADSIAETGLLQPITICDSNDPEKPYQLIAGERRWRAHILIGMDFIPAIIQNHLNDKEELQLIENINREDLSPFEQAKGIKHLMDKKGYKAVEVAKKLGKSKGRISSLLSILSLEPIIAQESLLRAKVPPAELFSSIPLSNLEILSTIQGSPYFDKALKKCFEGVSRNSLRDFVSKEEEKLKSNTEKQSNSFKTQLISAMGEEEKKHMKTINIRWNEAEKVLIKKDNISNDLKKLEYLLWVSTEESVMAEHRDLLERKLKIARKFLTENEEVPNEFYEMVQKLQNLIDAYSYITSNIKILIDRKSVKKEKQSEPTVKIAKKWDVELKDLSPRHIAFYDHLCTQFSKYEGFLADTTFQGISNKLDIEIMEREYEFVRYRSGSTKPVGIWVKACNRIIEGEEVPAPRTKIPNKHFKDLEPFNWKNFEQTKKVNETRTTRVLEEPNYAKNLLDTFDGAGFYLSEVKESKKNKLVLCYPEEHRDLVLDSFPQHVLLETFQEMEPNGSVQLISDKELLKT